MLVDALLDLCDGFAWVEPLGADLGAVHDRVAAVELVRIVQLVHALLGEVVPAVYEPPAEPSSAPVRAGWSKVTARRTCFTITRREYGSQHISQIGHRDPDSDTEPTNLSTASIRSIQQLSMRPDDFDILKHHHGEGWGACVGKGKGRLLVHFDVRYIPIQNE